MGSPVVPLKKTSKPIWLKLPLPAGPLLIPGLPELGETSQIVLRWEMADPQFAKALAARALPAKALAGLGVRLCLQNRYIQSLEVLGAALVLLPEELSILNDFAVVLERAGRSVDAILAVEHSLALSGNQVDSWIFLGALKRSQKDFAGAVAALETAISIDDSAPLAWQALGLIHHEQRSFTDAIDCLLNCLRLDYVNAALVSILGQLFYTTGQFQKSRDAYATAVDLDGQTVLYDQMSRQMRFVCAMIDGGNIEVALADYLPDLNDPKTRAEALDEILNKSSALLSAYGHRDAAIIVARKRTELFPESATANYMLCSIQGDNLVPRSPDGYLVESFNKAADRFDEHLVKDLGYDIPQKIGVILSRYLSVGAKLDVLDAGCGTGLCGLQVRKFARSLTGVDLAEKMLARAADRNLYDHLVCEEITAFLNRGQSSFDAIIAADVIIYFGALTVLAAAIARSLRLGGLLVFSTEQANLPGHHLLTSGRFAHDPDYVRSIFAADFTELLIEETTVRLEGDRRVRGNIFVFRRGI